MNKGLLKKPQDTIIKITISLNQIKRATEKSSSFDETLDFMTFSELSAYQKLFLHFKEHTTLHEIECMDISKLCKRAFPDSDPQDLFPVLVTEDNGEVYQIMNKSTKEVQEIRSKSSDYFLREDDALKFRRKEFFSFFLTEAQFKKSLGDPCSVDFPFVLFSEEDLKSVFKVFLDTKGFYPSSLAKAIKNISDTDFFEIDWREYK